MTDSEQNNNPENKLPKPQESDDNHTALNAVTPSENDSLDKQVQPEKAENETSISDKEFFDALEASVLRASGAKHSRTVFDGDVKSKSRLRRIELILLAGSVAIAIAFVYSFCRSHFGVQNQRPPVSVQQHQAITAQKAMYPDTSQAQPPKTDKTESSPLPSEEPLSLKLANDLFIQDDYQGAFQAYERLDQALPQDSMQQLMHSFLKLRMAICLKQMNQTDQAETLLRIISADDSCALAAMADYQRALIEFERKQYFEARICAYRAMALCEAVTADADWAVTLKKDCHFLACLALTRRIVSLCDIDGDIPVKLWRTSQYADFGCDRQDSELEAFLKSGNTKLKQALIGPKVEKLKVNDTVEHFKVISNLAPAEELFARFASNTNTRLVWNLTEQSRELRRRPVSLYLPDVTSEEFFSIAAGCVGLRATLDLNTKQPTLTITNPADYTDLSSHLSSIADEALERWQDFIIKYNEDKRLVNAHFACGIIHQTQDRSVDAVGLYKLVANRYAQSSLAPYALLYSSKIKAGLHDYAGAKQDLKQLVEQYHQTSVAQTAYLYLADAALKAALYDEAANTYCKVYNLDDSFESRCAASLGAARAMFAAGDYASAETWLARYLNLAEPLATLQDRTELPGAYMLLGKTQLELGKRTEAFNAFKLALHGDLTYKERTEIIEAILKCDLDKLDPIQALDLLETLQSQELSSQEYAEAVLIKCRILRKIHLADKALAVLNDRFDYILQPHLRAKAYIEIGQCYIDIGQIKNAHRCFTQALAIIEPGPLADYATLKLAELSLKLDKDDNAIELCSQLLERRIPRDLHQAAVHIMAIAYEKQNNYEKAVTLLVEQAETSSDEAGEKTASGGNQTQTSPDDQIQQDS
jgi:tetratricopeptide (TPR) repeat protein